MKAQEHRALGDAAAAGALVTLADESYGGGLALTFGDVVALAGDYFLPGDAPPELDPQAPGPGPEVLASGELFWLATVQGDRGTVLSSRDEIICALKVMAADQGIADTRFAPGGEFAAFAFSPSAAETEVENRVRDRFLALGASNDDHFVLPGGRGPTTGSDRPAARFGSALRAYRRLHEAALDHAHRLGREGGDLGQAMAREAAAQHYLTDAFAAGHLRTPVAAIREFWQVRYPGFWDGLRRKVAADTARALKELAWPFRLVSQRSRYERALEAVGQRTRGYPRLSFGDLLAKVFHDWDNTHGLQIEGGGMVFGDGCLDQGMTKDLALAAGRAGIDDVEVAFRMGASGTSQPGEPLYRAVRETTSGDPDRFVAETKVAHPSEDNPRQNWRAPDVETLWESPIVGTAGPTVGEAVAEALQPGEELPRRLDCVGQGFEGAVGFSGLPWLQRWLGGKACQAYHRGFLDSLVHDPKTTVLELIHESERGERGEHGQGQPDRRTPAMAKA